MDYQAFVDEQVASIRESVGDGLAINALSGGVDSSVVTAIGHRAFGDRLEDRVRGQCADAGGRTAASCQDVCGHGHSRRDRRRACRLPGRLERTYRSGREAQCRHA